MTYMTEWAAQEVVRMQEEYYAADNQLTMKFHAQVLGPTRCQASPGACRGRICLSCCSSCWSPPWTLVVDDVGSSAVVAVDRCCSSFC